jgi:ABC-type lipoprotein export system ATPase subunit
VLLELTHVAKHYFLPDGRSTLPVLRDVSLAVAAGDSVAVTGPSGSGKSTLLNIMGAPVGPPRQGACTHKEH